MRAPDPAEAQIRHQLERHDQIASSPTPVERLNHANELTTVRLA